MLRKIKSEEGFTLLEAIISIAALAIVSGFILKMFIVSTNVNIKAQNIDFGNAVVQSTIETFKSQKTPEGFFKSFPVENSLIVEDNDKKIVYQAFDKDFQLLKWESTYLFNTPSGTKFLVTAEVKEDSQEQQKVIVDTSPYDIFEESGSIHKIQVVLTEEDSKKEQKELIKLEADKYFAY